MNKKDQNRAIWQKFFYTDVFMIVAFIFYLIGLITNKVMAFMLIYGVIAITWKLVKKPLYKKKKWNTKRLVTDSIIID